MTNRVSCEKPDAEKLHVRLDERNIALATSRCGALLHITLLKRWILWMFSVCVAIGMSVLFGVFLENLPRCFSKNSTIDFVANLYALGVEEVAMRRVWHAGWIFAMMMPWIAIFCFIVVKVVRRYAHQLNRFPVFVTIGAVLAILSLPDPILPMLPGLDNSWIWMLNNFAFKPVFGTDTVFTYGPLGFLLVPQGSMNVCVLALIANVFFACLWMFELLIVFRSGMSGRLAAWLLMLTMFFPHGSMEWRWVLLAVLTMAIACKKERGISKKAQGVLAILAGFLLALTSLMKFSSLITVAGSQIMFLCFSLATRRNYRLLLGYAAGFCIPFSFFCLSYFPCMADAVSWLQGSLLIASGYNRYMGTPHSWLELVFPVVVLVGVLGLHFKWTRDGRNSLVFLVLFSPVLFCAIKYSWVRQGPLQFLYVMLFVMAMMVFHDGGLFKRMLILCTTLLLVAYAMVLPRFFAGNTYFGFPFGLNPVGILKTFDLSGSIQKAESVSIDALHKDQLPESWWNLIGNDMVMMFPDEYAPAMRHQGIHLVPLPSFQLYSGYLPRLDSRNAECFRGKTAPKYIVCRIDSGWRSGRLMNYPQTWRAILEGYEYVAEANGYALLRHCAHVARRPEIRTRMECPAGEWVMLPKATNLAISVKWDATICGKLMALFCRNTQTYVSFRFKDGHELRDGLVVENLAYPFPVACIPQDDDAMIAILQGERSREVSAIKFSAETGWYYSPKIEMNFYW